MTKPKPKRARTKKPPKRVLALPDLEQAKSAVLNSLASTSGQRTYDQDRRAFKLVLLEDVGPGWQIARTREIYTTFVAEGKADIPVRFSKKIGGVRVTDQVRDLGLLNLTAAGD